VSVASSQSYADDLSLLNMDNRVSGFDTVSNFKLIPLIKITYLKEKIIHSIIFEYNKQLLEYLSK